MKSKAFFDRLTVAIAAILLISFSFALCLLPKKDFSQKERRALTPFPTPKLSSVLDGSFFSSFSDFCTDHFPLRECFTALKATVERTLGKRENNGIVFAEGDYLLARGEYDDLTIATQNLDAIRALSVGSNTTTVAILPRSIDVMVSYLPSGYDTARTDEIGTLVQEILPTQTDITAPLRDAAESGEAVFYRTDHHWTTDGAYLAYIHLAPSLGITPYAADYFTPTVATDAFLGTAFARSGLAATTPDTITLYRYAGDDRYTVTNGETEMQTHTLYDFQALQGDDPYEVFLGGNYARLTVIDESTPEKPTLLLFKDSFANPLIPFLALHFQLVIVDPRYEQTGARAILDEVNADRVLILLGADTVATTPALKRLGR